MRLIVVKALLCVLVVVATGCSSDSKPDATPSSSTASVPGRPGELITNEPIPVDDLHGSLLRVAYHSRSVKEADITVSGLIAIPSTPPPDGGYPVISWAHGTTGIADECAPSREPQDYVNFANALLDKGYLVVATDYEGLGTPGRHPYLVGDSEARGAIDIVRAARNIPDAHASDRYVVWGHSQGGHAAMFALHIAAEWAPELKLQGVVAGAPPSQLLLIYQALQTSPFRHYLLMGAAGFNAAYGDDGAPLDEVLTPKGVEEIAKVDTGCAGDLALATAGIPASDIAKVDPATVPTWSALLKQNDPGQFTAAIPTPLLIIHGGSDEQIPVLTSQLMFDQLCKIGQIEQRWVYPGQNHAGVVAVSLSDMLTWIGNRFSGGPAPDPLIPTGQPDVQTQSCPP